MSLRNTRSRKGWKEIRKGQRSFGFMIAVIVASAFFVSKFIIQIYIVQGSSMQNTFKEGDILLINKIHRRPERYDIVVFKCNSRTVVKRIIGLPGEKIMMKGKNITANGSELEESYGFYEDRYGNTEYFIELKDNEYFVLGDNRNHSIDSRDSRIGNIESRAIVGAVICKLGSQGEKE